MKKTLALIFTIAFLILSSFGCKTNDETTNSLESDISTEADTETSISFKSAQQKAYDDAESIAASRKASGESPHYDYGVMAITFDDGPGPYTDKLLDALKERGIHGTFFVVGSRVNEFNEEILREYNEGHEIGNHTYNHTFLSKVDTSTQISEIQDCKDILNSTIGEDVFGNQLVRPPGGYVDDTIAQNVGEPIILWSIDTLDWKYRDADYVKEKIIENANDGEIILLHDLYETSVDGIIAAIDELSDRYTFCTVSELFERKGQELEDGVIYTNAECNGVDLGVKSKTEKTEDDSSQDENEDSEEKNDTDFPWYVLIFCVAIVLIGIAGVVYYSKSAKETNNRKQINKNNEKNNKVNKQGNRQQYNKQHRKK